MFIKLLTLLSVVVLARYVSGHGMLLDPPNRSSLWRYYNNSPINYNDNQNFCGGRAVQWEIFGGKCGVCGDRYDDPRPQDNENTGLYGQGIIAKTYTSGSVIDAYVLLTANHLGNFQYGLCVLDDSTRPEPGEDCFVRLPLSDGSTQYNVTSTDYDVHNSIVLPQGLKCATCVLRWHYTVGNSWGDCGDGTYAEGCGPQETFRSCADISIV